MNNYFCYLDSGISVEAENKEEAFKKANKWYESCYKK